MASIRTTHTRIYSADKEKLKDLSFELSKIQRAEIRIPEVIRRMGNLPNLKDILFKDAELKKGKMNRRGQQNSLSNSIIFVFIMMGVFGAIFLMFFVWGILGAPLLSTVGTASNILEQSMNGTQNSALINATAITVTPVNSAFQNLAWIGYSIFIFMLFGFLGLCFYVREYPFLIIFWFLFILVFTAGSIYLSDAYNDVRTGALGAQYQSHAMTDYLMQYLPHLIVSFGLVGGFIMFVIVSRDGDLSGGVGI